MAHPGLCIITAHLSTRESGMGQVPSQVIDVAEVAEVEEVQAAYSRFWAVGEGSAGVDNRESDYLLHTCTAGMRCHTLTEHLAQHSYPVLYLPPSQQGGQQQHLWVRLHAPPPVRQPPFQSLLLLSLFQPHFLRQRRWVISQSTVQHTGGIFDLLQQTLQTVCRVPALLSLWAPWGGSWCSPGVQAVQNSKQRCDSVWKSCFAP